MEQILRLISANLSLFFAFAFLVPVIAQCMQALGIPAPFGLPTVTFAILVGGTWGLIARISGRWV